MKLRLNRKLILLCSTLAALLLAGVLCTILPGTDPVLKEIAYYAQSQDKTALQLQAQLKAIKNGQDVNTPDAEGYTPLMNAARTNNAAAIDYLLIKGARLHTESPTQQIAEALTDDSSIRALLHACALAESNPTEQEREQMRQNLRKAYISPDNLTQALFRAVRNRNGNSAALTAQVLALGGNANAMDPQGQHILQQRRHDSGSMVLLLRQGADPNAVLDSSGGSVALIENAASNPRNAKNLITRGASAKGAEALAKAVGKGDAELAALLLTQGANPNGVAKNNKTVLEHAVQGLGNPHGDDALAGTTRCVQLLLEAGARTEYTPEKGETRSPVSPGGISIQPETLRLLLNAGADVNAKNSRGANYAHIAAYKKATPENVELLKDIIAAGADLKHKDNLGETFLFYALPGMCELPVADPDDNIRENAISVLEEMFSIIKKAEPDPAALDRNGNTALHLAVIRRGTADDRVIDFLLKLGVDPAIRNKFGRTALEAMLRNPCGPRSKYVARLLTRNGPLPTDAGLQLVLAAMTDDTAAIRQLLEAKPSQDIMAVALGCVQNATAADLLLKAGAPGHYENMAYMVRHGNPDVVRIFAEHQRLDDLKHLWKYVRTEAMAKAFTQVGLMPESPGDIANEKVLRFLLTHPEFNANGTRLAMTSQQMPESWLLSMVKNGRSKMTRLLLEHGVSVNGHTESPLTLAKDADIAKMLIDHGADLTAKTRSGDTLLSAHKNRLVQLAKAYQESPTTNERESFRAHSAIAEMLADAGVTENHPQRDEIKARLQRGGADTGHKVVQFICKDWSGPVRISEEAMVLARASGNTDTANIISLGPDRIKLKWDRWGYCYMEKKADGAFYEAEDEDFYRDFKETPTKVPHHYIEYVGNGGKEERLYLHPDFRYAVNPVNKQSGKVCELRRNSNGGMKIDWETGGDSELLILDGKLYLLNEDSARIALRCYHPSIAHKEIAVVGDSWEDTMKLSEMYMVAVRSSGSLDAAKVLRFDNERLTVKWDRWGEETFIRQNDGKFHKYAPERAEGERVRQLMRAGSSEIRIKTYHFRSSHWQDTVAVSFKHKIAMRSSGSKDTGTVVRYDKDSITIKWDRWKEDTFVRQQDNTYRSTNHP